MNGKIALEEHYNAPELAKEMPPYYAPEMMKDIVRRLSRSATSGSATWTPPASTSRCCR